MYKVNKKTSEYPPWKYAGVFVEDFGQILSRCLTCFSSWEFFSNSDGCPLRKNGGNSSCTALNLCTSTCLRELWWYDRNLFFSCFHSAPRMKISFRIFQLICSNLSKKFLQKKVNFVSKCQIVFDTERITENSSN